MLRHTMKSPVIPRVYVACLAAYNNGFLHGEWIDLEDAEHVRDDIRRILETSPVPGAEEYAIHDTDDFGSLRVEYSSPDELVAIADFIREYGQLGLAVLDYVCGDLKNARIMMQDQYVGEYKSEADFAEQFHDEIEAHIDDRLRYYIDWEAVARDMVLNGDITAIETGHEEVHIFWG